MVRYLYPYEELEPIRVSNPLQTLARAARSAMCQIRQAAPYLFDWQAAAVGGLVPDFMLARNFYDSICNQQPLPPSTAQDAPFRGGQCNQLYNVAGVHIRTDLVGEQAFGIVGIQGPIQRIFWTRTFDGVSTETWFINAIDANGNLRGPESVGSQNVNRPVITDRFIRISPDFCTPSDRPITINLPPIPPSNVQTVTNINLGGQIGPFNVSLPDLNVNNWPDFEFRPVFDIGGITFEFGLGGITIDLPDSFPVSSTQSSSVDLSPVLNSIDDTRLQLSTEISEVLSEIDSLGTLIEDNFDSLESLIRCCCCEENVTYEEQILAQSSPGNRFALPDNTVAVRITASGVDPNLIRTQAGSGDAPTVYFWGWYSIAHDDADGGERIQLSFLQSAVFTPERARFIAVCPYFGALCTVTAIVKSKNCQQSEVTP